MKNFDHVLASVALAGQCTLRQREQLPNTSGIYFVTDDHNNLLYLGKATNLRSRWAGRGHHRYKQFARKGLDKITLSYVLAPVDELNNLERQYIQALKPLLNDGRVKVYLPKKSLRLSELQRLLKLVNTNRIRRPVWDSFRGFVAGTYIANNVPRIVVVCQQNMGETLENSSTHRTKKRFYTEGLRYLRWAGVFYEDGKAKRIWKFDARVAVFEFVEFFTLGDELFERFYPHLGECQIVGVKLRKLNNTAYIQSILQTLSGEKDKSEQDYMRAVCADLQPLSTDFALTEKMIW